MSKNQSKAPAKRNPNAGGKSGGGNTGVKGGTSGSGPRPNQPNWLLAVIWAVAAVFLFRTCSTPPSSTPPTPAQVSDLHAQLVADNAQLKEVSAAQHAADYIKQIDNSDSEIDNQIKNGKISSTAGIAQKNENETKRLEAQVLVADVQMRAGEKTGDFGKYTAAYQTLSPLQRQFGELPVWNSTIFNLPKIGTPGNRTWSGQTLYEEVVTQLSAQSKLNKVYGIIPGYEFIDFLVHVTGAVPGFSYWFAALLLAVIVRAIIWPLSQKQLMWGRQMAQLAPLINEIKQKYKNDQTTFQTKSMELYKEYGLNPLAGCLPALVQLPLFLTVYQCMLHYRFEFQKGTFAWINPSFAAKTHDFYNFTASNLGQMDKLLIIIYAISLLISTLLTPVSNPDPSQARQQRLMGVVFSLGFPVIMFTGAYPLPCAFVLYWTFTNILATAQSLRAYYWLPTPALVKVNTMTGGVYPTNRKQTWMDKAQDWYEKAQAQELERKREYEATRNPAVSEDDSRVKGSKKNPSDVQSPSNGKGPKSTPRPSNPSAPKSSPKRRTDASTSSGSISEEE